MRKKIRLREKAVKMQRKKRKQMHEGIKQRG
jgi:hypothetical protein